MDSQDDKRKCRKLQKVKVFAHNSVQSLIFAWLSYLMLEIKCEMWEESADYLSAVVSDDVTWKGREVNC